MIHKINPQGIDQSRRVKPGAHAPIDTAKNSIEAAQKKETPAKDKLMLSKEGLSAAEVARYTHIVKNMPDVDLKKVEEVRAKIDQGEYLNPEVADRTAEKLLEELGES
jgi:anti-sigma28 factor (negative regulator of flagellin synthesis)